MNNSNSSKIFISSNAKLGGPNTFVSNLKSFFKNNTRVTFVNNLKKSNYVLLIGENFYLKDLILALILNKKTYIRLDGRRFDFYSKTSFKREGNEGFLKYLKSVFFEIKVAIAFLVSKKVIYQSKFTRRQWINLEKLLKKEFSIIINPFYLNPYEEEIQKKYKDISIKIESPRYILASKGFIHDSILLSSAYKTFNNMGIKIMIFGNVSPHLKNRFPLIDFYGYKDSDIYKKYLFNCFAFLCVENNACCPNSLIEAQSIGKPIIGPNNGSLPEMCPEPNIQLLNYGKDLDKDLENLTNQYIQFYDIWVNKTIDFSRKTFGPNQYNKYYKLFSD